MATRVLVGHTLVEVVEQKLLQVSAPAVMLSANNHLKSNPTHWSWSQAVENLAGP